MIHTRKKEGWVLPWAHAVKHLTLTPSQVKIINVVGERVKDLVMNDEEAVTPGTYFDGKFPTRAFEPLVRFFLRTFTTADSWLTYVLRSFV